MGIPINFLMYCFSLPDPALQANPLSQLSQLTIQIHTAAIDLSGYESYFGSESVGYVLQGAEAMMGALQSVLGSDAPETKLGERETRHDFRNKLAVVKGFGDLMKMDLPESHAALIILQRLSERCMRFSALLDAFAPSGLAQSYRLAS